MEKMVDNEFMIVEMAQDHTDALVNLVTATKSDRDVFMYLSLTNAVLMDQLLELNKKQGKSA